MNPTGRTSTALALLALLAGAGCDGTVAGDADAGDLAGADAMDAPNDTAAETNDDTVSDAEDGLSLTWDPSISPDVDYTDGEALRAWLAAGTYRTWVADSGVLPIPSTGGSRRIWWNASLADSMDAMRPRHPLGSMGIRENYDPTGARASFSLMIRVSDDPGPSAWLYYEHFAPEDPAVDALVHGLAPSGCVGCHRMAPGDFVFEPDADPFVACRP